MKIVNIKDKLGNVTSPNNIKSDEELDSWINHCKENNVFGKPERWVRAKVVVPPDSFTSGYTFYPDETYDESDVLEQKQMEIDGEFVFHVKLKAEYTIEITDYAPPVPSSISPAQARLALLQAGFYDDVQNAVATSTDQVRIYWGYATSFERTNPILTSMASAIGITEEQLDDLFRLGITFK